jgi:predicted GNAT superfamily acetyltransferase
MLPIMTRAPTEDATRAAVTVRDVRGADELRACQELQRRAWGITEDGYVMPVATMASAQRVGGLILGAFDANRKLIGFAFGFLGKLNGRYILWSQLTGVHPAHQSTGVGRLLKLEQRRRARDMGLEAVVWAFDPLQASNAAFNLGVLGATSRMYEEDMYGSRTDALNVGMATDRLLAEWSTSGEPGGLTAAWSDAIDALQTEPHEGFRYDRVASVHEIAPEVTHLKIEIPPNLVSVKAHAPPAAVREWQLAVRSAFQAAFAKGFVAVGFTRADSAHPRYLLERAH